jgi:hypothetical protein
MHALDRRAPSSAFTGGSINVLVWFSLAWSVSLAAEIALPPPATHTVDYMKGVKPLLSKHCYECHGIEKQEAGLRLDARQNALRGGDYGPVITQPAWYFTRSTWPDAFPPPMLYIREASPTSSTRKLTTARGT